MPVLCAAYRERGTIHTTDDDVSDLPMPVLCAVYRGRDYVLCCCCKVSQDPECHVKARDTYEAGIVHTLPKTGKQRIVYSVDYP